MNALLLALVVVPIGEPPKPLSGTLYGLPYDNGFQRLYQIGPNGAQVPVNGVGDLGTRYVDELFLHAAGAVMYGRGLVLPAPGEPGQYVIATIGLDDFKGTIQASIPNDLSNLIHHPQDSRAYGTQAGGTQIVAGYIGGQLEVVYDSHGTFSVNEMAYVDGFLGRKGLLLRLNTNTLAMLTGPPWTIDHLGGSLLDAGPFMIWDQPTRTLWFAGHAPHPYTSNVLGLWLFDEDTGIAEFDTVLGAFSPFPEADVVYIPPAEPHCTYTDTDADRDIDLADFAEFQNCMTGPCPCNPMVDSCECGRR